MKAALAAMAAGLLFGLGLGVSGMTQPAKVQGFLDFAGAWDPSLLFVMGGAIAVHFVAYRLVRRRAAPVFESRFHVPTSQVIDWRLVGGAALFGVGWGLGGYCPGPVLVAAAAASPSALLFVVAMAAGMLVADKTRAVASKEPEADATA